MAYIGKIPATGAFQKCDALSASGTADYTLQVGSTNVVPESVNHMIVSLNGVIQSPTTAYTVSGSTLSFASSLTSSDTIDFVMLLGNVLDIGTPSDDTVTLAKMASGTDGNIISYDTSGNPAAVSTGSDGQVLTSAGAGAVCAFEAVAPGSLGEAVRRTSALAVAATTQVELVFNAENYDVGSKYDTSTGRYTPGVAGTYFVSYGITLDPGASFAETDLTYMKIRLNGAGTEYGQIGLGGNGNGNLGFSSNTILTLDDDDYISLWCYIANANGGDLVSQQSGWSVFRII